MEKRRLLVSGSEEEKKGAETQNRQPELILGPPPPAVSVVGSKKPGRGEGAQGGRVAWEAGVGLQRGPPLAS